MATMIPDWDDDELQANITTPGAWGEIELYKRMRELNGDWTVIYDRSGSDREEDHQYDFLVIVPGKGIVNVDAKGHTFHVQDGEVYRGEHRAKVFDQARNAIHSLDRHIRETFGVASWGAFGSIVAFLDMNTEIPSETRGLTYLLRDDLVLGGKGLEKAILAVLSRHSKAFDDFRKYGASILGRYTLTDDGRHASPEFSDADVDSVRALNVPQRMILSKVRKHAVVHVRGAAGTGKTVIACKLAQEFVQAGLKVLYVCYNNTLAEYLSSRYNGKFSISSFFKLGKLFGKTVEWSSDFDEDEHVTRLKEVFENVRSKDKYDVLLIDEAQDMKMEWIEMLQYLIRWKNLHIVIFSDADQSLYSSDWKLETSILMDDSGTPICEPPPLGMNFRNRENIYDHYKQYDIASNLDCYLMDGRVVVAPEGAIEIVKRILSSNEGRVPRNIVILSNKISALPMAQTISGPGMILPAHIVNASGKTRETGIQKWLKDKSRSVLLATTIHQFKGLEADIVVLIWEGPVDDEELRYVGESRAKYELFITDRA